MISMLSTNAKWPGEDSVETAGSAIDSSMNIPTQSDLISTPFSDDLATATATTLL